MNPEDIVITGRGLVTPVGLYTEATCAALRAGVARLKEIKSYFIDKSFNDEKPVCGGRVPTEWFDGEPKPEEWPGHERFKVALPPPRDSLVEPGVERVVELARHALREALASARGKKDVQGNVGLYLGLDELEDASPIVAACRQQIAFPEECTVVFTEGRCAGLLALAKALQDIRRGIVAGAVVGGADSLVRAPVLQRLQEQGLVQSPGNPQGVVPGEAAGFLFIEKGESAMKREVEPVAVILAAACGEEPTVGTEDPNQAVGLTKVIHEALKSSGGLTVSPLVVCDLNGDRYRAMEWAFASMRTMGQLHCDIELWHPADCIGDSGAASGMLNIIWATEAFRKHYVKTNRGLIWGGSENSRRAAVVVAPSM